MGAGVRALSERVRGGLRSGQVWRPPRSPERAERISRRQTRASVDFSTPQPCVGPTPAARSGTAAAAAAAAAVLITSGLRLFPGALPGPRAARARCFPDRVGANDE